MVVSLVDQVFSFVETLRMLPQEDSGMPQAGGADHSEQQEVSARSRFRGLSWDKKYQSWRVRIYFGGKQRHVGRFEDEVAAAKAYDKAAVHLYGRNACTNFGLEACHHDNTEVSESIVAAKQEVQKSAALNNQLRHRRHQHNSLAANHTNSSGSFATNTCPDTAWHHQQGGNHFGGNIYDQLACGSTAAAAAAAVPGHSCSQSAVPGGFDASAYPQYHHQQQQQTLTQQEQQQQQQMLAQQLQGLSIQPAPVYQPAYQLQQQQPVLVQQQLLSMPAQAQQQQQLLVQQQQNHHPEMLITSSGLPILPQHQLQMQHVPTPHQHQQQLLSLPPVPVSAAGSPAPSHSLQAAAGLAAWNAACGPAAHAAAGTAVAAAAAGVPQCEMVMLPQQQQQPMWVAVSQPGSWSGPHQLHYQQQQLHYSSGLGAVSAAAAPAAGNGSTVPAAAAAAAAGAISTVTTAGLPVMALSVQSLPAPAQCSGGHQYSCWPGTNSIALDCQACPAQKTMAQHRKLWHSTA